MSSTLTDCSAFSLSLAGSRSPVLAASTMCLAMRSRTTSLWQGCGSDLHESSNAAPIAWVTSSSNEPVWIELQIINLLPSRTAGSRHCSLGLRRSGLFQRRARLGLSPDQDCSKQTDCPGLFDGGPPPGLIFPRSGAIHVNLTGSNADCRMALYVRKLTLGGITSCGPMAGLGD